MSDNKSSVNRLGYANLFLIAVNILATTFLGIYLAQRNEEFQKQLIDLQSKAELAHIDIRHEQTLSEFEFLKNYEYITFTNTGTSVAENLRLSVCLRDIGFRWYSVVNDITQFDVAVSNISRKYEMELARTGCGDGFASNIKNDSVLLSVETLPPGENVAIRVATGPIPKQHIITSRKAYAIIDKGIPAGQFVFDFSKVKEYINGPFITGDFYVAQFTGNASCKNCTVTSDDSYASATEKTFVSVENAQVLFEDENIVEITFDLVLDYFAPDGYSDPKNETPIYFQLNRYSDPIQFQEIYKEAYDKLKQ